MHNKLKGGGGMNTLFLGQALFALCFLGAGAYVAKLFCDLIQEKKIREKADDLKRELLFTINDSRRKITGESEIIPLTTINNSGDFSRLVIRYPFDSHVHSVKIKEFNKRLDELSSRWDHNFKNPNSLDDLINFVKIVEVERKYWAIFLRKINM
jgi:hypothetical protein